MKHAPIFVFILLSFRLTAQTEFKVRCEADSLLAPFYHGVASGDPTANSVILWTRITLDTVDEPIVEWRVAIDTLFNDVVSAGTATTNAEKDFCLHVQVTGLNAGTTYFYQFTYAGYHSLTGRTKTLAAGDADSLRFAIISCASLNAGYFNVYEIIKNRNDFDAVIFLGDYIYEYETEGYGYNDEVDRSYDPEEEIISVADYRTRHSQYKLDEQLRVLHQNFPFICIWDDHEFADNAWNNGAVNHQAAIEGEWADRVLAAEEAYFDWMPVTLSGDTADPYRTYRAFQLGDLMDLILLDTRIDDRTKQVSWFDWDWDDASRHLMSLTQRDWLLDQLKNSDAQWKVIGQQVMMSPLTALGIPINDDQWDGYPKDQEAVLQFMRDSIPDNKVVITGDIHSSWANDIATPSYNSATEEGSAGVEFVGPSVTSPSMDLGWAEDAIMSMNEHIKYIDIEHRGFLMLDVNKTRVQGDYYFINQINAVDSNYIWDDGWYVVDGSNFLNHATEAAIRPDGYKINLAPECPMAPDTMTVDLFQNDLIVLGIYPNPVSAQINQLLTIQFSSSNQVEVLFELIDIHGRVISATKNNYGAGLHVEGLPIPKVAAGNYLLAITTGSGRIIKKIVVQ